MASLIIISWRDIPAQVIVKRGRETAKVQLSQRFQEAVDRAAMRAGKGSSDAYLADWQRSAPRPCGDDLQAEANAEAARLEAQYTDEDSGAPDSRQRRRCKPRCLRLRRRTGPRVRLMYSRAAVVGAPCARPERLLSRASRRCWCGLHPLFQALGYERIERPVARRRESRQGPAVRLPHVRSMRAEFHRHVLPDELPQELAQWALRRRARQRQLRGQARHALRLGRGLPGQPSAFRAASRRWRKCSSRSINASKAAPRGCVSAREKAGQSAAPGAAP